MDEEKYNNQCLIVSVVQIDVSFEKWYYSSMDFILEISIRLYHYIKKKKSKNSHTCVFEMLIARKHQRYFTVKCL